MTEARFRVATIPGDGVGPEVVEAARRVVDAAGERFGFSVEWSEHLVGGIGIDTYGVPIRDEDLAACGEADAILLGAVGGPKWSDPNATVRPEQALFSLRGGLGLFANLRPVTRPGLPGGLLAVAAGAARGRGPRDRSRADRWRLFRRSPGGRGDRRGSLRARHAAVPRARDLARRPARVRSRASTRRGVVTQVDKANVLATSRLWRRVTDEIAADYPDVTLNHQLVDSCAMLLIRRPADFDVIVTENLFGDILSDEAAVLAGSLGVLAVGVARVTPDRARGLRPVRADPWLGARYRGPRRR